MNTKQKLRTVIEQIIAEKYEEASKTLSEVMTEKAREMIDYGDYEEDRYLDELPGAESHDGGEPEDEDEDEDEDEICFTVADQSEIEGASDDEFELGDDEDDDLLDLEFGSDEAR